MILKKEVVLNSVAEFLGVWAVGGKATLSLNTQQFLSKIYSEINTYIYLESSHICRCIHFTSHSVFNIKSTGYRLVQNLKQGPL